MAIKVVNHLNFVGANGEVFCKHQHKVIAPLLTSCSTCPYFAGVMQGHGHECTWEDVVPAELDEVVIPADGGADELIRVSKLIDQGYLQKG